MVAFCDVVDALSNLPQGESRWALATDLGLNLSSITNYVTLDKFLHLSELQYRRLQKGNNCED